MPLVFRNSVRVLGGWHFSWPDGDWADPVERPLLLWTFEDSEPCSRSSSELPESIIRFFWASCRFAAFAFDYEAAAAHCRPNPNYRRTKEKCRANPENHPLPVV